MGSVVLQLMLVIWLARSEVLCFVWSIVQDIVKKGVAVVMGRVGDQEWLEQGNLADTTGGVAENVLCFLVGLGRRGARFRYWAMAALNDLKSNEKYSSLCIETFCGIE